MKIDIRRLNTLKELNINDKIEIPEEYYKNTDIINIKNIEINGIIYLNHEEEIELNVSITGTFIMPCSITLEEVDYDFETEVNEILAENTSKNQFLLELLDVLWENIVSEVPIKVTKPDLEINNIKGKGWELEIE